MWPARPVKSAGTGVGRHLLRGAFGARAFGARAVGAWAVGVGAAQDGLVRLAQRHAGLDAQFVAQHPATLPVGGQRLGLPARPVQGHHQGAAQALPGRVGADEPDQLGYERLVPAQRQLGGHPLLDH